MALIPALFLSMFFVILAIVIIATITFIGKIGMSILSPKIGLKKWGLLWLPFVGSWYDGSIVSHFMNSKKKLWPIVFLVLRIIPALFYLALLWDINFSGHVPGPEMQFSDYVMGIMLLTLVIGDIVIRIIKLIAMLRGKANAVLAVIIGLFFPDFWTYFMISKVN